MLWLILCTTSFRGAHSQIFFFSFTQCQLVVSPCFQSLYYTQIKIAYLLCELLYYYNVPLNGCAVVLSLSSLKKNGVGWGSDDPSFLEPLRGGCGLVKS